MSTTPWYRRLFTQTLAIQFVIIALVLGVAAFAFARQVQSTMSSTD